MFNFNVGKNITDGAVKRAEELIEQGKANELLFQVVQFLIKHVEISVNPSNKEVKVKFKQDF